MTLRRLTAVLLAVVSLAAMVLLAQSPTRAIDPVFTALGSPTMPFVPSRDFISSSWFCPGVPSSGDDIGGSVVIANPSDVARTGRITAFTDDRSAQPVEQSFEVEARSTLDVDLTELQPAGTFVSALVEVSGGGGFVEQLARHPNGNAVAPCSNSTSASWYLADGFTLAGSTEELVITNPFPDEATVNVLVTYSGGRLFGPARLQGLPIPGRSVVVVDESLLPRDEVVLSVSLQATRGRVVLGRAQQYLGEGRLGYTMSLAAPSTDSQYYFADGEVGEGIIERYSVFNPGDTEALVSVFFLGVPADAGFANDLTITVAPGDVEMLNTADVPGLPAGRHGVVFAALNNSRFVVERAITRPAGDSVATAVVMGARGSWASGRWSMAVGTALAIPNVLVVLNVDGVEATVTVSTIGTGGEVPIPGLEAVLVPPGGVVAIDITEPTALGRPLVVESTTRVIVERLLERDTSLRGRSGSMALPN